MVWRRVGCEQWRRCLSDERLLGKRSLAGKGFERIRRRRGRKKAGKRKAVVRATARITRGREKEREAVYKAAVIGAASGVIPTVVVATRAST